MNKLFIFRFRNIGLLLVAGFMLTVSANAAMKTPPATMPCCDKIPDNDDGSHFE